jgi:hypothetical protein
MILVSRQHHHGSTEFAPAMAESNGLLPGFPAVCGKPVHLAFDGGRLTSDGGVLMLAQIERRLVWPNDWRSASKTRVTLRRSSIRSPR